MLPATPSTVNEITPVKDWVNFTSSIFILYVVLLTAPIFTLYIDSGG